MRWIGAAELGVAAIADGQVLQPAVDDEIDQRGGGEDAVGDEVAAEPVEDAADRRADDDDREPDLRIEVLADVEVARPADRARSTARSARSASDTSSGMSRPQRPHLMAAGASAARPADRRRTSDTSRESASGNRIIGQLVIADSYRTDRLPNSVIVPGRTTAAAGRASCAGRARRRAPSESS